MAVSTLAAGCTHRLGDNQQKYADSLLVAPAAIKPTFHAYPDGRQQVIYTIETSYPAEDVLAFLKTELQKRGWKALPESFFNPGLPSGIQRGWAFFEDHTQQPSTGVYAWSADWENSSNDITEYVLQYNAPNNSTYGLKNLQVTAIFQPANVAAKGRELGQRLLEQRRK